MSSALAEYAPLSVPSPPEDLLGEVRAVIALIHAHQRCLITSHQQPDGDALGASLALFHLLRELGKEAVVFNVDPPPFNFCFLDGADAVRNVLEDDERFDITFVLDCCVREQLGSNFPERAWGSHVVAIDHHTTVLEGADIALHDPDAAAVGELIYWLALELGVEVRGALAETIYCSLMADTGGFRYASTTPIALAMAGQLVANGVDVWNISRHIYEDNPVQRVEVLAKVLTTLVVSACGRIASVRISKKVMKTINGDPSMIDGFINYVRSIRGVEVAAQLIENSPKSYDVVFRSKGAVDVGAFARTFGGNGKKLAARCSMTGTYREVNAALIDGLDAFLTVPTP